MNRATIRGLENYYGPLPTAFKLEKSPYGASNYYISPWWVLTINKYQRDNLAQLLDMVHSRVLLLGSFNTGDWASEILQMLSKPVLSGTNVVPKMHIDEDDHPNISSEALQERLVLDLAIKISKADNITIEEAKELAWRYVSA